MANTMTVSMDTDVQMVAEFMQRNLPAAKLVAVANRISQLAPIVWGDYPPEAVAALSLQEPYPTLGCDQPIPPNATE